MICWCSFKICDLFHTFKEVILYVVIFPNILFMIHEHILHHLSLYLANNLLSSKLENFCFLLYRLYVAAR